MQEINLKLREANQTDLELISALATEIWKEHYTPIIGEAQVQYMLEKMYSSENLVDQVKNKKHIFYLVILNSKTVGFISVHNEKEQDWFMNKFYILGNTAAQGIGSLAFSELNKLVHPKKITLTVNRQNYKAINFYFKNNFKIDHVADFDIGQGYVMNDFVMVWNRGNGKL